jgi:hypothetical protein
LSLCRTDAGPTGLLEEKRKQREAEDDAKHRDLLADPAGMRTAI